MSGALEGNGALLPFPAASVWSADAEFHGRAPVGALAHVAKRIEPFAVASPDVYRIGIHAIPVRQLGCEIGL